MPSCTHAVSHAAPHAHAWHATNTDVPRILTQVTVHVSGIQCPSMGKRPPGAGTAVAAADSGTPAVAAENGEAAAAAPTVPVPAAGPGAQPEPFSREAKWFTEQRALGREVGAAGGGAGGYVHA